MNQSNTTNPRRHDLDALRAAAMLLGIAYHVALSFALGFGWMVQDVSQSKGVYLFQAFVHGFRMQMFMLVSGFFTAMLWRQKGLKALLWHRCRRVLFPCLIGLVTVVPAMFAAINFSFSYNSSRNQKAEPASASVWTAIKRGDIAALDTHLKQPGSLTNQHPQWGITPLTWAALTGQREVAAILLERGAAPNDRNRDGNTPLHGAAFMGNADVADLLIQRGADVNLPNYSGETALKSAAQPYDSVQYIAGLLGITVDKRAVEQGREKLVARLREAGAKSSGSAEGGKAGSGGFAAVFKGLTETPVFILLWFLWFLVWLVGAFSIYAVVADKLRWKGPPSWLTLSPATLLWLVPLTIIPGWFMGSGNGEFGPDTSQGILPMPHVLAYYAIFFFFGVLYHDTKDTLGRLGRSWRWSLPLTVLVVFPIALESATGSFGLRDQALPAKFHKPVTVVFQSLYAWLMTFGFMGMFRSLLTRENRTIRYLSDSSYWLYLSHLPLCIVLQALISQWRMPAWIKLGLLSVVLTGFLLVVYEYLIRYTWVGRMLNGPRKRTERPGLADLRTSTARPGGLGGEA